MSGHDPWIWKLTQGPSSSSLTIWSSAPQGMSQSNNGKHFTFSRYLLFSPLLLVDQNSYNMNEEKKSDVHTYRCVVLWVVNILWKKVWNSHACLSYITDMCHSHKWMLLSSNMLSAYEYGRTQKCLLFIYHVSSDTNLLASKGGCPLDVFK